MTCCSTSVGVGVGVTPITEGPPVQIFGGFLFFPRSLSFDFCYDFDIWAQGQALIAFFVVTVFFTISLKYEEDFGQTGQEAS